jgi:hypothetical protein
MIPHLVLAHRLWKEARRAKPQFAPTLFLDTRAPTRQSRKRNYSSLYFLSGAGEAFNTLFSSTTCVRAQYLAGHGISVFITWGAEPLPGIRSSICSVSPSQGDRNRVNMHFVGTRCFAEEVIRAILRYDYSVVKVAQSFTIFGASAADVHRFQELNLFGRVFTTGVFTSSFCGLREVTTWSAGSIRSENSLPDLLL